MRERAVEGRQEIVAGVRRAAFSNEAGMGTAPMAHGAAKTSEPIREGLVAMLGPLIDTILICTMTALAIIITGVWTHSSSDGITLTAEAFDAALPFGSVILLVWVCRRREEKGEEAVEGGTMTL